VVNAPRPVSFYTPFRAFLAFCSLPLFPPPPALFFPNDHETENDGFQTLLLPTDFVPAFPSGISFLLFTT